jgi:hypothetical protein
MYFHVGRCRMVAAGIHTRSPAPHVIQHPISRRSRHARLRMSVVPARVCELRGAVPSLTTRALWRIAPKDAIAVYA